MSEFETIPEFKNDDEAYSFIVDVDGFGGPLHLLLDLAKQQKLDLLRISILKLADQYLDFIAKIKTERIELAADYLVMAAWLAYLKSRLLLPKRAKDSDEKSPELLSSHLAWRLKRLESMRKASELIMLRPQTGIDVFTRGLIDETSFDNESIYEADLLALLKAYGRQRNKSKGKPHKVAVWPVYSLEEARENLSNKVAKDGNWYDLASFIPKEIPANGPPLPSFYASLLSAGLEGVKQGNFNLFQKQEYDNVYIKSNMFGNKD